MHRPSECPIDRPTCISFRRLPPVVLVDPTGEVNRPKLAGLQEAAVLRERLTIPEVVATRLGAAMFDHVKNASITSATRASELSAGWAVTALSSWNFCSATFLFPPSFRQTDLLPAQRHHPPPRVLSKPDLVRAGHATPPVKEPETRARPQGLALAVPRRSGGEFIWYGI
jgi:hypothetical protein